MYVVQNQHTTFIQSFLHSQKSFTFLYHLLSQNAPKKRLSVYLHGNEPKKQQIQTSETEKKSLTTHNVQEEPTINGKATNITNKMRSE